MINSNPFTDNPFTEETKTEEGTQTSLFPTKPEEQASVVLEETPEEQNTQQELTAEPLKNNSGRVNLLLGPQGRLVNLNQMETYATPRPQGPQHTPIHPIDHLYTPIKNELTNFYWEVEEEFLAMDDVKHTQILMFHIRDTIEEKDGYRYFGDEAKTTIAIINNNIKKGRVVAYSGVQEMICMNHSADGEVCMAHVHKKKILERLQQEIPRWISQLRGSIVDKRRRRQHLKNHILEDNSAKALLFDAARDKKNGIIKPSRMFNIYGEFKNPTEAHNAPPNSAFLMEQAMTRTAGFTATDLLGKTNRICAFIDEKTGF